MFEVRALEALSIEDTGTPPAWSAELLARIDASWERARAARPALTDGEIFSVTDDEPDVLRGSFVPYRAWLAQREDPALAEHLRIRPLAVSGITHTPDGIVFGRRGNDVTQNPGQWELVPSGGVDREAARAPSTGAGIDARHQILAELTEELNVPPAEVATCRLVGRVADHAAHVLDLVFELHLSLSREALLQRFATRAEPEYTDLSIVPPPDVDAFLASAPTAPITHQLLSLARA